MSKNSKDPSRYVRLKGLHVFYSSTGDETGFERIDTLVIARGKNIVRVAENPVDRLMRKFYGVEIRDYGVTHTIEPTGLEKFNLSSSATRNIIKDMDLSKLSELPKNQIYEHRECFFR